MKNRLSWRQTRWNSLPICVLLQKLLNDGLSSLTSEKGSSFYTNKIQDLQKNFDTLELWLHYLSQGNE